MIRKLAVILLSGVICLLGATSALAYNEVPMLKALVDAGELPPVEERLPLEPKILSADRNEVLPGDLDFEIGQYGGTLRMARSVTGYHPDLHIMSKEALLMGRGILGEDIKGNILEDFEISDDGKIFTFYMRKGLKWSDGMPVTTEDVLFAYEDVLLNEELTASFPRWLRAGNRSDGEPMELDGNLAKFVAKNKWKYLSIQQLLNFSVF